MHPPRKTGPAPWRGPGGHRVKKMADTTRLMRQRRQKPTPAGPQGLGHCAVNFTKTFFCSRLPKTEPNPPVCFVNGIKYTSSPRLASGEAQKFFPPARGAPPRGWRKNLGRPARWRPPREDMEKRAVGRGEGMGADAPRSGPPGAQWAARTPGKIFWTICGEAPRLHFPGSGDRHAPRAARRPFRRRAPHRALRASPCRFRVFFEPRLFFRDCEFLEDQPWKP